MTRLGNGSWNADPASENAGSNRTQPSNRARARALAPRHEQVAVAGVDKVRNAKHPDNGIDRPVVLTNQREFIDGPEDHCGRPLINRVVGQQKRKRDGSGDGSFSRFQSQASLKQTMPMRPACDGYSAYQ